MAKQMVDLHDRWDLGGRAYDPAPAVRPAFGAQVRSGVLARRTRWVDEGFDEVDSVPSAYDPARAFLDLQSNHAFQRLSRSAGWWATFTGRDKFGLDQDDIDSAVQEAIFAADRCKRKWRARAAEVVVPSPWNLEELSEFEASFVAVRRMRKSPNLSEKERQKMILMPFAISAYMRTTMVRWSAKTQNRRAKQGGHVVYSTDDFDDEAPALDVPSPEDVAGHREEINQALETLQPSDDDSPTVREKKDALRRHLEGESFAEIATSTQAPYQTARSRVQAGKLYLRDMIRKEIIT